MPGGQEEGSFNYTVRFTPDVHSGPCFFFQTTFHATSDESREPIKVQARDLVSRQEPVPRISGCRENSFGILPENSARALVCAAFLHADIVPADPSRQIKFPVESKVQSRVVEVRLSGRDALY